jgi:hypothetical protein
VREREYINASEVADFLFCERSWFLSRQGKPSVLEPERAKGVQFHQQHSDRVQEAPRARMMAALLAAATMIILVLWMLWTFR